MHTFVPECRPESGRGNVGADLCVWEAPSRECVRPRVCASLSSVFDRVCQGNQPGRLSLSGSASAPRTLSKAWYYFSSVWQPSPAGPDALIHTETSKTHKHTVFCEGQTCWCCGSVYSTSQCETQKHGIKMKCKKNKKNLVFRELVDKRNTLYFEKMCIAITSLHWECVKRRHTHYSWVSITFNCHFHFPVFSMLCVYFMSIKLQH